VGGGLNDTSLLACLLKYSVMEVLAVAVIPARGGSVGIPHKNLMPVAGVPLLVRAIEAARSAGISHVVVSTDDADIEAMALRNGADVVRRPAPLASGVASSEAAILHALDALAGGDQAVWVKADSVAEPRSLVPKIVVFLQATSPFIRSCDISDAINRVVAGEADCVFSAVVTHAFQWGLSGGKIVPVGHPGDQRQMRQELPPRWQETGGFYVMRHDGFRASRHRFFGQLAIQEVPEETHFEIDAPMDLRICNAIAPLVVPSHVSPTVDAIVTDFDGVHTDDRVIIDSTGIEQVVVNRRDGLGVAHVKAAGKKFLILSTERNIVVAARGAKLGVDVLHGVDNKKAALEEWLAAQEIDAERVAYLGNDVNDLEAMGLVGWPCATADADPAVRSAARIVLRANGGGGAVRELCDLVLGAAGAINDIEAEPTNAWCNIDEDACVDSGHTH